MTIKTRFFLLATLLASLMANFPEASAESFVHGTAYGEKFGLIHFNYTTGMPSTRDADEDGTPDYLEPEHFSTYHLGPRQQVYIPRGDINYDAPPPDPAFLSRVSDFGDMDTCGAGNYCCDTGAQTCYMHGFA
ncbi:hypothetical protein JXA05_04325, partial [Candidatus Peregrinibacteria bacterium]|nr:hypothetical protein [Candidatus Peregrinibacteria bacterium]